MVHSGYPVKDHPVKNRSLCSKQIVQDSDSAEHDASRGLSRIHEYRTVIIYSVRSDFDSSKSEFSADLYQAPRRGGKMYLSLAR